MIKINKTLGLALLTALAASCSSDNDVAQSNNPTFEKGESAFATIRINLPTQSGTRALSLVDGLPSEYAVNDGTLLVFKKAGKSEGDYTFVQSVDLGTMTPWSNVGETGVTTTAYTTVQLDKTSYDDLKAGNIYGLVILNNGTGTAQKITLPDPNQTFSVWNNDASKVNATNMLATSKGIVMANAPEWKPAGTTPLTLAPIDGKKVYTTAAQAEAVTDVAANIYVERGLAKVTMDDKSAKNGFFPQGSYKDDEVLIKGWVLDVTNKSSFPVHNVDGLDKDYADIWKYDDSKTTAPTFNRFHDATVVTPSEDEEDEPTNYFRRVYWGKDPNYNTDPTKVGDVFNLATTADLETAAAKAFGDDNPKYCLENTFDIGHMKQNQTTRVLFKAIYLYGKMTSEPDKITKGDTFYKIGDQSGLYTEASLKTLITNIVKNVTKKADGTGKVEGTDYTLDLGEIATVAGSHPLTDANFKAVSTTPAKAFTRGTDTAENGDGTTTLNGALTKTEIDNVNAQLNGQIKTYLDGVCYYIGRIKHFGNDETPWSQGNDTYGTPGNNLNWLGRYGVLRNNWYSLKVNSISGPGEPVIPDTPDTPDDDNYNYINLSVKVLKWAKRGQELHF